MRMGNKVLAVVLATALAFSSATVALAEGGGWGWGRTDGHGRGHAPYRISKAQVADEHVATGVAFDASGSLTPAIATGDSSTVVVVQVWAKGDHRRPLLVETATATVSPSADASSSTYDAAITLGDPGAYALVSVVEVNGAIVARSSMRPIFAVLPFKVSRPQVSTHKAIAGVSFDTTVVVDPVPPASDTSVVVTFYAYQVGKHDRRTLVASATAAPSGDGSSFATSMTVPAAGHYVLVAVLSDAGVVVGRSGGRELRVVAAAVASAGTGSGRGKRH